MSCLLIIESRYETRIKIPELPSGVEATAWEKGQLRRSGERHETAGVTVTLGKADLHETRSQFEEAVAFLEGNTSRFLNLISEVDRPEVDLVFTACIEPPGIAQDICFPRDVVRLAAELGATLSLRTFLVEPDDEVPGCVSANGSFPANGSDKSAA